MRPYILAETNWKSVKDVDFELAVLPWGATEAHNYHLPYATDNIEAERISAEAARIAWERGAKVIVLPAVPYGVNTGQPDIKLDMNIYPSTQLALLLDILETLNRQNIKRFILLNSHGGNNFKPVIREAGAKYPGMFLSICNWFEWKGGRELFENPGNHADEMETSLLLYLAPQLVRPLTEAGDGKAKCYRIKELNQGWVWAERRWSQITEDTGVGNPKAATKDKGELFFKAVTNAVADVFFSIAKSNPDDLYEY
jgi:creatinine amidohydrolase